MKTVILLLFLITGSNETTGQMQTEFISASEPMTITECLDGAYSVNSIETDFVGASLAMCVPVLATYKPSINM